MSGPEQALVARIREIRRRHFGRRGKAAFAAQLGVSPEEYEQYERGTMPSGEMMVRICETTGEDLQWLLTGMASRGTVVISGARHRHQGLLSDIARLLEERPEFGTKIEAFVKLLLDTAEMDRSQSEARLPAIRREALIPIYALEELHDTLPGPEGDGDGNGGALLPYGGAGHGKVDVDREQPALLAAPSSAYAEADMRPVRFVAMNAEPHRWFLFDAWLRTEYPRAFGVRMVNDSMVPMFRASDTVLVSPQHEARVGRPALCKRREGEAQCRIWLGSEGEEVILGRMQDWQEERVGRAELAWSLEVLFRVSEAA